MRAIHVKYLGPTNTRGSRYQASSYGVQSAVVPIDYSLPEADNRLLAAGKLIEQMGWKLVINGRGFLPNGDEVFTLKDIEP